MLNIEYERNEKLEMAIFVSPLSRQQICQLLDINDSTLYRTIVKGNKLNRKTIRTLCKILSTMPHELGLDYE